jgi:hypothetical protein
LARVSAHNTQYITSLLGQGGAGIPQKGGGGEEAESHGGRSEEDTDGTGDETQGGEEQGRDQVRNKAMEGDRRKIQIEQEMRLREEKNKEEIR